MDTAGIDSVRRTAREYQRLPTDSHCTHNYLELRRNWPIRCTAAKTIVEQYKLP